MKQIAGFNIEQGVPVPTTQGERYVTPERVAMEQMGVGEFFFSTTANDNTLGSIRGRLAPKKFVVRKMKRNGAYGYGVWRIA